MASSSPNSFRDPYWSNLASKAEQKYDITPGLLVSVLTNGERSNANQKSEVGASTVFQITPTTRDLILKRDGIDAYLRDENAAEAAALVLKDGVNWAKGRAKDPIDADRLAAGYYHAGGDTANWGPKTAAYMNRVMVGHQGEKASALDNGFAKFMAANPATKPASAPAEKKADSLSEGFGSWLAVQNAPKVSIPGAEESDARAPAPDPTIGERIVGTGEAALSLGTGMVGGVVGPVVGLANAFTSPDASQGSLQAASDTAGRVAQDLTYAPRTASGQSQTAFAGNALANAIPLAGMTGELATAGRAASALKPTAAAIPQVARNAVGTAAENVAAGVRSIPERVGQVFGGEPAATPTPGTMGSVGAAGVDMATQRRMSAQELPVPMSLTEGQATRTFEAQRFERETAKDPALGAPIRERFAEQNNQIRQNLDAWIDQTGAEAPDLRAAGVKVDKALQDSHKRDKTEVNVKYAKARKSEEAQAPVDQSAPVSIGEGDNALTSTPIAFINDQPTGLPSTAVTDAARQYAVKLGIADMADGQLVPKPGATVANMEAWRSAVNDATGYDPAHIRQATILKKLIDGQTDPVAGPLYREARRARENLANKYENNAVVSRLLNNKRGTNDRQVALEDVFAHSILQGSLDDVRTMRKVLQTSGEEGQQAWKELQGQTVNYIKEQANGSGKNVSFDTRGNPVISPAGMNKAIKSLDSDGKLDFVFGKKGAEQLRMLNDVAQDVLTAPPGSVNTSNTAAVLLAAMDMAISGAGGMPLPIASGLRMVVNNVKDRRVRLRVAEALGDAKRKEAAKPKPIRMNRTTH